MKDKKPNLKKKSQPKTSKKKTSPKPKKTTTKKKSSLDERNFFGETPEVLFSGYLDILKKDIIGEGRIFGPIFAIASEHSGEIGELPFIPKEKKEMQSLFSFMGESMAQDMPEVTCMILSTVCVLGVAIQEKTNNTSTVFDGLTAVLTVARDINGTSTMHLIPIEESNGMIKISKKRYPEISKINNTGWKVHEPGTYGFEPLDYVFNSFIVNSLMRNV